MRVTKIAGHAIGVWGRNGQEETKKLINWKTEVIYRHKPQSVLAGLN